MNPQTEHSTKCEEGRRDPSGPIFQPGREIETGRHVEEKHQPKVRPEEKMRGKRRKGLAGNKPALRQKKLAALREAGGENERDS